MTLKCTIIFCSGNRCYKSSHADVYSKKLVSGRQDRKDEKVALKCMAHFVIEI